MTAHFDPSADFADVADGTETVTLRRRGSTSGAPAAEVSHALRRAVTSRAAAQSDGRYTAGDVVWHLPHGELDGDPRPGDVIADGDGRWWTILEAQLATLRGRWRCVARDVAVAHGLDDTIAVLKATYSKEDSGAAVPSWQIWKTGVRARIQPVVIEMKSEHEARRAVARYRIFVEVDLALDHTHRIQGPDGKVYKILSSSGAERLGELATIEAELVYTASGS